MKKEKNTNSQTDTQNPLEKAFKSTPFLVVSGCAMIIGLVLNTLKIFGIVDGVLFIIGLIFFVCWILTIISAIVSHISYKRLSKLTSIMTYQLEKIRKEFELKIAN